MVLQGLMVQMELQEQMVQAERMERMELQELMVRAGLTEQMEHQELMVLQVQMVLQEQDLVQYLQQRIITY